MSKKNEHIAAKRRARQKKNRARRVKARKAEQFEYSRKLAKLTPTGQLIAKLGGRFL